MGAGVFVAGTDTGVGKTVIAAGILHSLRSAGVDAVPMKPVQTGASHPSRSQDLEFCLQVAGTDPDATELGLMSPYCLKTEASPHLAARLENVRIDTNHILCCLDALRREHEAVVVEGAGGILVPLNESETMLDLIRLLSIPVVLVARRGLGTINHTLLSLSALQSKGVEVSGIILNETAHTPGFIAGDNAETIARLGKTAVLGSMGLISASSEDEFRQRLKAVFREAVPGWTAIMERLRQGQ